MQSVNGDQDLRPNLTVYNIGERSLRIRLPLSSRSTHHRFVFPASAGRQSSPLSDPRIAIQYCGKTSLKRTQILFSRGASHFALSQGGLYAFRRRNRGKDGCLHVQASPADATLFGTPGSLVSQHENNGHCLSTSRPPRKS